MSDQDRAPLSAVSQIQHTAAASRKLPLSPANSHSLSFSRRWAAVLWA